MPLPDILILDGDGIDSNYEIIREIRSLAPQMNIVLLSLIGKIPTIPEDIKQMITKFLYDELRNLHEIQDTVQKLLSIQDP